MLKNILNLEGIQKLTNAEQKEINGGKLPPPSCGEGWVYVGNVSSCVCATGSYNATTGSCMIGANPGTYSGRTYENATGCCSVI